MMITAGDCMKKYGTPNDERAMRLWAVPKHLWIGAVPHRLYCNKDLIQPLTDAFQCIIAHGLEDEIKTWDGCFNIRNKRNGASMSLHSWGIAIDINAAWNRMGAKPTMNLGLVACFTDAGFEWGGNWENQDGMHFQLARLP